MSELRVTLPNGTSLSFMQAVTLARLREQHGVDKTHWHLNNCKCCLTLHAPTGAYVINSDGDPDFFPGAHCDCAAHVTGQTDV